MRSEFCPPSFTVYFSGREQQLIVALVNISAQYSEPTEANILIDFCKHWRRP